MKTCSPSSTEHHGCSRSSLRPFSSHPPTSWERSVRCPGERTWFSVAEHKRSYLKSPEASPKASRKSGRHVRHSVDVAALPRSALAARSGALCGLPFRSRRQAALSVSGFGCGSRHGLLPLRAVPLSLREKSHRNNALVRDSYHLWLSMPANLLRSSTNSSIPKPAE